MPQSFGEKTRSKLPIGFTEAVTNGDLAQPLLLVRLSTDTRLRMTTQTKPLPRIEQVPLVREFLSDHQKMSKLLLHTLVSLEEENLEAATASAKALDRIAGGHIAFEEAEIYPRISGEEIMTQTTRDLYAEHREALTALKKLLDNPKPNQTTKREILRGLRTGVHHAERCEALADLLAALPMPEQNESLKKLRGFREQGRKWTDRMQWRIG